MRHKHADVIHAWAEGEEIQVRYQTEEWLDWNKTYAPFFVDPHEWRIKPKKVKKEGWVNVYRHRSNGSLWVSDVHSTEQMADHGSEGITSKKVACIRIEWEEEECAS